MCKIGLGVRLLTASLMISSVYLALLTPTTTMILLIFVLELAMLEFNDISN